MGSGHDLRVEIKLFVGLWAGCGACLGFLCSGSLSSSPALCVHALKKTKTWESIKAVKTMSEQSFLSDQSGRMLQVYFFAGKALRKSILTL